MTQISETGHQAIIPSDRDGGGNQPNFVAFRVSAQDYCVDILSVREINGWTHVTPLPKSEPYIRGVINLRGSVVPVLDCRLRFGLEPSHPDDRQVIIVVQVGERILGLLVDEVSEILNIPHSEIKPVPDADAATARPLVTGVFILQDRMIRLVDLDQIAPAIDLEAA